MNLAATREKQATIQNTITIEGPGLSGEPARAVLIPAEANHGIVFNIEGHSVPATAVNLAAGQKSCHAILKCGDTEIRGVTHLLAAAWAIGIDNLTVELSGNDLPLPDFAAKTYAEALRLAGRLELDAERELVVVEKATQIDGPNGSFFLITPEPKNQFSIEAVTDFELPIGIQGIMFVSGKDDFTNCFSAARPVRLNGLSPDEVAWQNSFDAEPSSFITCYEDDMLSSPSPDDEPIRHEIIDVLGHLAVIPRRLQAKIRVFRPNDELLRKSVTEIEKLQGTTKN